MPSSGRAVCIHGHYYQPPREHPWLGVVEPEPSAAPEHDWNVRILRECYAPNADARLLDAHGRIRRVRSNYAWTSFDVGPTLDAWLAEHAPDLVAAIVAADRESVVRTGWGNAWAQAYNHPILPLCTPRDVATQVRWGARAFELRYGRRPDGMWLPEMAVDVASLEALAAEGVTLTMLSPHQLARIRPLGSGEEAWTRVTPDSLDVRQLYRCVLPSRAAIDVVVREASGSQGLAFGELLRDGGRLVAHVKAALADAHGLVTLATDGETFGHHHRFGEMAIAYAIERLRREGVAEVTNPAAYRAAAPPAFEAEIVERSSWSCAHGVERWRDDCGCRVGDAPGWTQAWRRPLRAAIAWLRDELARLFESAGGAALRDPWRARDRYVDAVIDPARAARVVGAELRAHASAADLVQARRALELARHALLMQTSCGWFFDDVAGVEATLVIRQAGRAIDLARALGARLEAGFLERLEAAESNVRSEGTAADVYRRTVTGRPVTPARVAATAVLLDRLGEEAALPGYAVTLHGGDGGMRATVREERTGACEDVVVHAPAPGASGPSCTVDGRRYGVANLFLVQRARLMRKVAHDAVAAVRAARRAALAELRAIIDPLIARDAPLPLDLAMLLGYEEADRIATLVRAPGTVLAPLAAEVLAGQQRGVVLPVQGLARALGRRLVASLAAMPEGAAAALDVLRFTERTGLVLDLAPAQVAVARWWQRARPTTPDETLAELGRRLSLSPELAEPDV